MCGFEKCGYFCGFPILRCIKLQFNFKSQIKRSLKHYKPPLAFGKINPIPNPDMFFHFIATFTVFVFLSALDQFDDNENINERKLGPG